MIEEIAIQYIGKALDIGVYPEKPEKPPKRYLVIEKTAGGCENHINAAMLAIQSCAESLYEAAQLNERAKKAMRDFALLDEICKVELNSDYNFTDTTTKEYRYQAVFDITYY